MSKPRYTTPKRDKGPCANHPDRPARTRGLCMSCYQRQLSGPSYNAPDVERQAAAAKVLARALARWPATPHPWA